MKNLSRITVTTFIILVASKVLGFTREVLLAYKYGTSYINDAYAISTSLPGVLFAVFASGIAQSYIPVCSRINSEEKKTNFFSNIITVLFCLSIVVTGICIILDKQIVALLAPGFDVQVRNLTETFVDIVACQFPIYIMYAVLNSNAQMKESFIFPNFCDYIVVNILMLIFIALSNEKHPEIMVFGYVVSMLIATIALLIYSKRNLGFKYIPVLDLKDENFQVLLKLAIPIGLCVMANQLNSVTDRVFASMLGIGYTSALEYANRIQSLFLSVTTSVFVMICYPRINGYFASGNRSEGVYYIKKACSITSFFAIPFMLIIIFYAEAIVSVLFERGVFNSNSTKITAECLKFYAIGIPFYAYREVSSKALAADLKQKMIMKNTILAVAVNILLDMLLYKNLKHIGLALATSLAGIICALLMFYDIRTMKVFEKKEWAETIKIFVCALISLVASKLINDLVFVCCNSMNGIVSFFCGMSVFFGIYVFCCFFMKVEIISWIISRLCPRRNK